MFGFDLMQHRLPEGEPDPPSRMWRPADHENALLLFFPVEFRAGVKTVHGEADAVFCDRIVNLDTGEVLKGAQVFGSALTVNIKDAIPDQPVMGRLGKGVANGGNKAPWVLFKFEEEDRDRADAWIKANV